MTLRTAAVITAALILSGCASMEPAPTWKAAQTTDEFTDKTTSIVTTGDFTYTPSVFASPLHLYPVVRKEGGEIYVGVMSGGRFKMPVGTVQLRVDQNEAWTITPQETPVFMIPAAPSYTAPNLTPEQQAIIKSSQDQAMLSTSQLMSPYTITGGDKAKQIIKQMASGRQIKYRTVGINQASSTTGEAVIDPSFARALKAIGVDPNTL